LPAAAAARPASPSVRPTNHPPGPLAARPSAQRRPCWTARRSIADSASTRPTGPPLDHQLSADLPEPPAGRSPTP